MIHSSQRRSYRISRILPLVIGLSIMGNVLAAEPGMLPSLDTDPAMAANDITPIAELTGLPMTEASTASSAVQDLEEASPIPQPATKPEEQPTLKPKQPAPELKPATAIQTAIQTAKPAPAVKPALLDEQPTPRLEPHQAETPAVETKPAKHKFSWSNLGLSNPFQAENAMKPVSYTPLPGIAIFPVVKHGNETAFSDLPLIFAREYALKLEQKVPETKVFHPIYTVDELRIQGMGHVYDQVLQYYRKAGRPEPVALDYLLKQLGSHGHSVSRVIFVEADLDTGSPDASTGLIERAKALLTDATPTHMRYFVRSHLQVFDAEKPEFPMVWSGNWSRTVKNNQFFNVTPSVFADSDSQQAFAKVSREMSRELLYVTPKEAYMAPQYDTQVQGKLVSGKEAPFPNLTNMKPTDNPLTKENRQAIQRILQRQNTMGP